MGRSPADFAMYGLERVKGENRMRRFHLVRERDPSEVSGIGIVAEGIQFYSGQCVLCWITKLTSVAIYEDIETLIEIHGHDGATTVRWYDPEPIQVR